MVEGLLKNLGTHLLKNEESSHSLKCVNRFVFILALTSMPGCQRSVASTEVPKSVDKAQVYVETLQVKPISDEFIYPAKVLAEREIEIVSEVGGLVQTLAVQIGEVVKAGQLLATVINPDPLSGYQAFHVKAPFAGEISSRSIQAGDRVQPGQKIIRLVDTRSIKFQTQLNSGNLPLLTLGSRAEWSTLDDQIKLPVKVTAISRVLDSNLGTALCEMQLVNGTQARNLPSGMLGRVRFSLNPRQVVLVSQKSLVYKEKKPHLIMVGANNKAQYLPIEMLRSHDDLVEIKGALKPGSRFVSQSSSYVGDGEDLNILNDEKK